MDRRRTALLLAMLVLAVVVAALWLWPQGSSPPAHRAAAPLPHHAAPIASPPRPEEPPPPIPAEGGPSAWFPDQRAYRCPSPAGVPDGRYTAGGATVLVRAGEVLVLAPADGSSAVRQLGTDLGTLTWSDGTCTWAPSIRHRVSGTVAGGGQHSVAGCPVGEVVRTDTHGDFETFVFDGSPCTLRVVGDGEALAMGARIGVAGDADVDVTLEPAEPLADTLVAQATDQLARMAAYRIESLQTMRRAWTDTAVDDDWARWMVEQLDAELAFMEAEQARLDDPEQSDEVVREFLYGLSN